MDEVGELQWPVSMRGRNRFTVRLTYDDEVHRYNVHIYFDNAAVHDTYKQLDEVNDNDNYMFASNIINMTLDALDMTLFGLDLFDESDEE
jgi:hypothetical protein